VSLSNDLEHLICLLYFNTIVKMFSRFDIVSDYKMGLHIYIVLKTMQNGVINPFLTVIIITRNIANVKHVLLM